MTYRLPSLALALALLASGCGDDSTTTPSPTAAPTFTAIMLPSNEVPAITNADQTATGNVIITMNNTTNSAGAITASTANFTVTMSGFPAGTTLTGAHIHNAPAGTNAGVIWNLNVGAGEFVLPNGSLSFTRTAVTPTDVAFAQGIISNPSGFYFNVHTTLNTGGAIRGQLVRTN